MDLRSREFGKDGLKRWVSAAVAAPDNDASHLPAGQARTGSDQASSINPLPAQAERTGAAMGDHMQLLDTAMARGVVQHLRDRLDGITASGNGMKRMAPTTKQWDQVRAGAITDNQHLLPG